jgi:hypothetical protein
MVRDILPGPDGSGPTGFTDYGDGLIFGADDGIHGSEPWLLHPDREVKITLLGSRLGVSKKGFAGLKLSCPENEANGPCSSKITVTTRKRVRVGGKRRKVILSRKAIQVLAGNTGTARLTFSRRNIRLLKRSAAARRVLITVNATDNAGNKQTTKKKYELGRPA